MIRPVFAFLVIAACSYTVFADDFDIKNADEFKKIIPEGAKVQKEALDLEAQLAVLQHPVGNETTEVSRAGNENSFEADPGAPSAFQQLAYRGARDVREQHVEDQKERPYQLRHLIRA